MACVAKAHLLDETLPGATKLVGRTDKKEVKVPSDKLYLAEDDAQPQAETSKPAVKYGLMPTGTRYIDAKNQLKAVKALLDSLPENGHLTEEENDPLVLFLAQNFLGLSLLIKPTIRFSLFQRNRVTSPDKTIKNLNFYLAKLHRILTHPSIRGNETEDGRDMEWGANVVSLIQLSHELLEGMHRRFIELNSPVYAWKAYQLARTAGIDIPSWVLMYLDACADGLASVESDTDIATALQFKPGKNLRSAQKTEARKAHERDFYLKVREYTSQIGPNGKHLSVHRACELIHGTPLAKNRDVHGLEKLFGRIRTQYE